MLHENNLNYTYEREVFELPDDDTYTPDFIIGDQIIVEVKGWPDGKSKERARLFMQKYPRYLYVVVGNRIPCDKFIDWEDRGELIEIIREEKS